MRPEMIAALHSDFSFTVCRGKPESGVGADEASMVAKQRYAVDGSMRKRYVWVRVGEYTRIGSVGLDHAPSL